MSIIPFLCIYNNNNVHLPGVVFLALDDRGFNIQSPEAIAAKKTALTLKDWMTDDKNHYLPYDNYMLNFFNMWTSVAPTSSQIREQIWVRFSLFTSVIRSLCKVLEELTFSS